MTPKGTLSGEHESLEINAAIAQAYYEGQFEEFVTILENHIIAASAENTVIDMTSWFYRLSFDFMGFFAYGRSFGMLQSGKTHEVVLT